MWSLPLICDLVKPLGGLQMQLLSLVSLVIWSRIKGPLFLLDPNKPHQEVNNVVILAKKNLVCSPFNDPEGCILIVFHYLHFAYLFKTFLHLKNTPCTVCHKVHFFMFYSAKFLLNIYEINYVSIFFSKRKKLWIILMCFFLVTVNAKHVIRLFCLLNTALTCLKWATSCRQTPYLQLE